MVSYAARANKYARAVRDGKVDAAKMVKLACERHLRDIEQSESKEDPYKFDSKAVKKICEFAENMVHIKGKWAEVKHAEDMPYIRLEDWQCFLLGGAFGWLRKSDGLRRFREIYWEIPRKNGKSMLGAVIGDYMLIADGEKGAEVFSGATSMDQAYQVFRPAWLMVKKNPEFAAHFNLELGGTERNPGNIYQLSNSSRFEPLIGKPGDGASPHCAIIDEYHEHAGPELYDAMKTGMGARSQPMRVIITTAGTDTSGPCYEKHQEAVKVLDGSLGNDDLFTCIYGMDDEDRWDDFAVWKKANPNFGVSVFEDYLRGQMRDALQSPSQQNIILTKNLNKWMSAGAAWMNMATWERQRDTSLELEQFRRKKCWLGVDLANKIDIASIGMILEAECGFAFFAKHYLPEDTIELPANAHYRKWRDMGWLTQTDGARTDFRRIENDIKDMSNTFAVQGLVYDQREASYLISSIEEWASFDCIEVVQGPAQMSEPMKEMEAAIVGGQLRHCGDPVLTWMMGNVVKKQSRVGGPVKYYYPTKDNDKSKIDGVVAGIMALSLAMIKTPEKKYQAMFF